MYFTLFVCLLYISQFFFSIVAPECEDNTHCPNEGKNYVCIANLCQCKDGFELNGDACEVQGNTKM